MFIPCRTACVDFLSAPNVFHSVTGGATNVIYRGLRLNAETYENVTPKNTDGFDVGASHVTISNVTVTNQDDCVAFKPNANYVTVTDITCTGSHGLSVGSLAKGSNDVVSRRIPPELLISIEHLSGSKYLR